MEFEDWLVLKDLSPSTIKKYAGAIAGPLTTWALQHNITSKALRQVRDPAEFASIVELIGGTEIFKQRNQRGNSMYSAALNNYAHFLARDNVAGIDIPERASLFNDQLEKFEQAPASPFEPNNEGDARERALRAIVRRRGQPKFRFDLISAYEGRCAITGCNVLPILEAAHVTPYLGPETNAIGNGLLLRADIHTLWDLRLIAIDLTLMTVSISPTLHDPTYQALAGKPVFQPVAIFSRVSLPALAQQWDVFRAHLVKDQ